MADEIKLKAPTVEQQVVVNISGEDKLEKFADTLDKISKGRGLQKYWKDQQTLINDTIKAYNNFNKSTSQTDATELIKTTNALKAMAGVDISTLIPDFDKFTSALSKAEGIAGHLTDAFTEKAFRDAFSSFETLKAYGLDLENFFKHFELNADVDKLVSELNNANDAVSNLKSKVTQLEDKLEESESGNGIRAVREECENLRWEIERIRDEAAETFSAFLTSNNINAGSYQYEEFFERIREGSLTAQEAIAEFKRDYSYLLESGASFDTTQLQDFSRRLDDVLKRITDVSEKIDYISSNGVRVSDFGGSGSGNFEELANVVNQIENTNINGSASAIYESLSKILTAIKEIGQCDTDNLYHLYSTIRNLAQLNDLKVNKASLDNLADCLERICRIDNSSALTNLSLVNFKNFNDLHISKASLNNLAEYLPQISNIDVGTLTALASLDFDKLNSLHIDKDSMKNLFSFVEGLRNATGLTDFTTENKNVESSADASTSSLKTEAELMESIATNAEKAAKAKKEFVEANKELAKATETSSNALSKENSELGEMGNKSTMKDTFQGDKIEQATTSAKELDKTLEQVDIPKDSFDEVINKLKLVEIKAENIVKITKQMRIGEGGKPVESYTLKDKYGSTEIYGVNSDKEKGQLLSANYVEYDAKQAENFQKNLNQAYEEAIKVNNALNETKAKIDGLSKHSELATQFSEVESTIATLNVKLTQGEISVSEYNKAVKETTSSYIKLVDIQQKRDVEVYNADAKKASEDAKRKADEEAEALKQKSEAWEKNVKAIQEYMDANTKLNNLKAQDKGTGKKSSEIAYQTKEVERLEKVAIEARAALSSMINPHEAPIDDWNKWLEAMKQFDQATEGSARSVARLEDALRNMAKSQSDKIGSIIDSNQAHLDKLRPSDGNRSVDFEKAVQEYNKAIIALKEFHATLDSSTPLTKKQSEKYEELSTSLREARIEMEKFSASEKGSTESSRWKEIDKITKYLEKNTRISKIAKQQLEDLVNTLKNVSGVNVDNIHLQFNKIAEAERAAGREGKRFWDILTDKAVYGAAAQLAGYYLSLTDFIRYGKQMVDTVIEIDTALTELRKVSDATEQRLSQNFKNSAETAKELGASISDVISASADWSRMGFDIDESEELARVSTLYVNVGDGIDVEEANNSLISTLQGFQMDAEEAESIVDKFNEVAKFWRNCMVTYG